MKKLIPIIMMAIIITSCSPGSGRWVAGNKYHFEQRKAHRSRIIVQPNEGIAFKKIEGKKVMLPVKPGPDDLIVISVIRFNKD